MAVSHIHSINKALFALGILLLLANFLMKPHSGYWFSNAGIFLIVLSAVLSFYLVRDQKAQINAHKEKIALHETKIADQKAEIDGQKVELANKDSQIADMKQAQTITPPENTVPSSEGGDHAEE